MRGRSLDTAIPFHNQPPTLAVPDLVLHQFPAKLLVRLRRHARANRVSLGVALVSVLAAKLGIRRPAKGLGSILRYKHRERRFGARTRARAPLAMGKVR